MCTPTHATNTCKLALCIFVIHTHTSRNNRFNFIGHFISILFAEFLCWYTTDCGKLKGPNRWLDFHQKNRSPKELAHSDSVHARHVHDLVCWLYETAFGRRWLQRSALRNSSSHRHIFYVHIPGRYSGHCRWRLGSNHAFQVSWLYSNFFGAANTHLLTWQNQKIGKTFLGHRRVTQ